MTSLILLVSALILCDGSSLSAKNSAPLTTAVLPVPRQDVCASRIPGLVRVILVPSALLDANVVGTTRKARGFRFTLSCERRSTADEWKLATGAHFVRQDGPLRVFDLPSSNTLGQIEEFYIDPQNRFLAACDRPLPAQRLRGCTVKVVLNPIAAAPLNPRLVISFGIDFDHRQAILPLVEICRRIVTLQLKLAARDTL
jgi:hypothetical protein